MFFRKPMTLPTAAEALPGRSTEIPTAENHFLSKRPLKGPYPEGIETVLFGMGCFWGAERKFWELPAGIWITAAGYAAGHTPNPTYEETCSGKTGHNEVVLVAFDPEVLPFQRLLQVFFENHDPTQGMRQGNDVGTQYRSGIYTTSKAQHEEAVSVKNAYESALKQRRIGPVTTEILAAPTFYYAEAYHQQYLAKNPQGYCGIGGTGVSCPIGLGA